MEDTAVGIYVSPIGPIQVTANNCGIQRLEMFFGSKYEKVECLQSRALVDKSNTKASNNLGQCMKWLSAYFTGDLEGLKTHMPLLDLPKKGEFYLKVWNALLSVSYGSTVSYGELAAMAGSPGAARAVGQAVHQHNFPLLVPCHRVVYKGGGIGNYSGGDGTSTKEWLLKHETQSLSKGSCL